MHTRVALVFAAIFAFVSRARAGMTVYDLNDVVRLRLEDISFFTVLLLLCGLGIRFLWNYLAKDFVGWPKLTFGKALSLTALLSLLMLLVLSMISGARELLTPGAWRRQGSAYRLNDSASEPLRRASLEGLRAALQVYCQTHGGKYPEHDFVPEIPDKVWQSPDAVGTRYIYFGHPKSPASLVACEPISFGDKRFVLLGSGQIETMTTATIREQVGLLIADK